MRLSFPQPCYHLIKSTDCGCRYQAFVLHPLFHDLLNRSDLVKYMSQLSSVPVNKNRHMEIVHHERFGPNPFLFTIHPAILGDIV